MIIIIISGVIAIVLIIVCISVEISRRQMKSVLPEAEVKIHLAIIKLEQRQAEKIARNEFQRYNRLRDEKLMKKMKKNDILHGR